MSFDNTLLTFDEIGQPWSGILIGNGASRAVSPGFAYSSLYEKACSADISHPIAPHEQTIFDALDTRNFEQVLSAFTITRIINSAFGQNFNELQNSYDQIRAALVEAVHAVHIQHADIPPATLEGMRAALLNYDFVYSTNYDLLLYWAVMQDAAEFRDYFFSGPIFDLGNTEVWQKSTKILFLHGGLHLYRTRAGQTYKRAAGVWGNLLDQFATPIPDQEDAVPLFITEGTSTDKLRSIYTSDYLSFAYSQFARHSGPLVIFGHALDNQYDQHLISAIKGSANRVLGISIHPSTAGETVAETKAKWFTKFHNFELFFFDASTHPLGAPALQVAAVAAS
jgi:hypothetical protein